MSRHHIETIKCSKCGNVSDFIVWESVNADLDPELKEKIYKGELFLFTCPECGDQTFRIYNFLYHDMKSKTMIFFVPIDSEVTKFDTSDLSTEFLEYYSLRVVYGYVNLLEKIHIIDSGLKDIAIERMKYMITHFSNPEILQRNRNLHYAGWKPANPAVESPNKFGEIFFAFNDSEGNDATILFDMGMYYEQEKAVEIDPRMRVEGWQCIDQEWMDTKLRRIE